MYGRRGQGNSEYVYLDSRLLAERRNGAVRFLHTDALGTASATTAAEGQALEHPLYTPFGGSLGSSIDGVGYTSHVMDAVSGLTYAQQRYMDPQLGVFLSMDGPASLS